MEKYNYTREGKLWKSYVSLLLHNDKLIKHSQQVAGIISSNEDMGQSIDPLMNELRNTHLDYYCNQGTMAQIECLLVHDFMCPKIHLN